MNRESSNFELQIEVNLEYDKSEPTEVNPDKKKAWQKITPAAQVERVKVRSFYYFLPHF